MIPKKIHYCWLSDDDIPIQYQEYISEWKIIMPDYEIIKWDRNRIDLNMHPFAKAAFDAKKYAFAADYIRVYALYTEGGIYLDSDVKILRPFDNFLSFGYFTSFENHWNSNEFYMLKGRYFDKNGIRYQNIDRVIGVGLQAAVIASESHHPLICDLYNYYTNLNWNKSKLPELAPYVHAKISEKYDFKYIDKLQLLKCGIGIFPSDVFTTKGQIINNNTHAIHMIASSWVNKTDNAIFKSLRKSSIIMFIYRIIKILLKSKY